MEPGHLLLLVCVFWLTCLWYLIMQFLVWEIILLLYKLKPIQIFQQVSACSSVQKCRSTPAAVLLSPLCTPIVLWDLFWNHSHRGKNLLSDLRRLKLVAWFAFILAHSSHILHQPSLPMCTLLL